MRDDINQLTNVVKEYINAPKTFLEIGSYNGADAVTIANYWNLKPQQCYIIEANPKAYYKIKTNLPDCKVYNFAASNKTEPVTFRVAIHPSDEVSGMSSVLHCRILHKVENVVVEGKRIDDFLNEINEKIDLVKIDVEGFAYQVLLGFGDLIDDVDAIQVETEKIACWYEQKTHSDVDEYLVSKNFKLVEIKEDEKNIQYDCLYINNARQLLR
jgi:FkbM family methyltransferase